MHPTLLIVLVFVFYGILEFAWLSSMSGFYQKHLRLLQPNWSGRFDVWAGLLCYLLLAFVIWWFVIETFSKDKSFWKGLFDSALLGLAMYGVYNLTNKATLDRYGWNVVVVDSLWGSFVIAAVFLWARYLRRF